MDRLSFDTPATELQEHNKSGHHSPLIGGQTEVTRISRWRDTYLCWSINIGVGRKSWRDFLAKANGKTLFTAELAEQFGFSEDHDTNGSFK